MPDINLLPDELREKEEKELKSVRKKPKVIKVAMSSPAKDQVEQPLKRSKPSLLSRLFFKKVKLAPALIKQSDKIVSPSQEITGERVTKKIIDIPKVKDSVGKVSADKEQGEIAIGQKAETEPTRISPDQKLSSSEPETSPEPKEKVKFIEKIEKPAKKKKEFSFRLFKGLKLAKSKKVKPVSDSLAPDQDKVYHKPDKKPSKRRGTILDINLIPEELTKHPELEIPKKLFSIGLIAGGAILLLIVGYLGISWYQLNTLDKIENLQKEIILLDQKIVSYEQGKRDALEFQRYLKLVRQLLDEHVYWTQFFDLLQQYTISEVYYTNFSMAGRSELAIQAIGRDYESVAEQLVAFEQATDFVKNVRIDSASAIVDLESETYQGVNFTVNLEFLPEVFFKPID